MLALALFGLYPIGVVYLPDSSPAESDGTEMQSESTVRRIRSDRGASALEFALVIPVLLLLLFGIIEFGVIFQNQLAMTHAAREGARMAAVGQWNEATVKSRAYPVVPTVTVSPTSPSAATHGQAITVTLTHNYDWVMLPFPGTIQLRAQAVMRRE